MKVAARSDRTHKPFDEIYWVSRLRENLTSGSDGEGLETGLRSTLNGHAGGNPGYSQGHSYELPRQSFTRQLVIKRMKSVLAIDKLRARENSVLAELYLDGKLLYTWVLEKRARRRCGEHWNRLDQPRRATPWRMWKLLRQELAIAISGVCHWDLRRWQACLEVIQERPRQRQLQTLPPRVNRLIAYCQANGLSNI